ncbi:MAG: Ppx/GppA phosphatase family protein [Opitutales bacterium]
MAVIDVGSNSIKLLVAALCGDGSIETKFSETVETRISGGISRELPVLSKTAMASGIDTIIELLRQAREFKPERIAIVATSAVRDAMNGMDFIDAVEEATGFEIRVLSGMEEARYIGKGLGCDPAVAGIRNFIQMDIGGGSLELIRLRDTQIEQVTSLRLGAVRISERFIGDPRAPVSRHEETAIHAYITAELTQSCFFFAPDSLPLIATGGAFVVSRAVLAAQAGVDIEAYSPTLQYADLERLKNRLCALSLHERLAVPHLPASRADIIPGALITILAVLRHARRQQITHSFYNLRYGIAAELLA